LLTPFSESSNGTKDGNLSCDDFNDLLIKRKKRKQKERKGVVCCVYQDLPAGGLEVVVGVSLMAEWYNIETEVKVDRDPNEGEWKGMIWFICVIIRCCLTK
jgi:hypothetical protein